MRGLPKAVLLAADAADAVRAGSYGSAWFAHRDDGGAVSHIEIRGPDLKGSVRAGHNTLFALPGSSSRIHPHLVLAETPIDS